MKLLIIILGLFLYHFAYTQTSILKENNAAYTDFEQGEQFYIKGDYAKAIPLLQSAQEKYSNPNAIVVANALHSLALLKNTEKEKAYFSFYNTGKTLLANQEGLNPEAKISLNYCMSRYYDTYNKEKEFVAFIEKVDTDLKAADVDLPPSLGVEIYDDFGVRNFRKGDYAIAKKQFQKAIAAAQPLQPAQRNQVLFAEHHLMVGELAEKMEQEDEALKLYQKIIEKKTKILGGNENQVIEVLFRMGNIYAQKQQYNRAIEQLKEVLQRIEQSGQNHPRTASTKSLLADIYTQQAKYKKALQHNINALSTWKNRLPVDDLGRAFESHLNQGLIFRKLKTRDNGVAWYQKIAKENEKDWLATLQNRNITPVNIQKKKNKAVDFNLGLISYTKAEELLQNFPPSEQTTKRIEILLAKGALFYEAEDYPRASENYQSALSLMRTIYDDQHPWVAEASSRLSQSLLAQKKYEEALAYINKAIKATMSKGEKLLKNGLPDINKTEFPFELLTAISTRGVVMSKTTAQKTEKNLLAILENYEAAIQLLNRLRKTHKNEGSKYRLSAVAYQFCQQAVVTANSLYLITEDKKYLDEAFKYAEISKSAVLLGTIRDLQAKKIGGIPQEFIDKEYELKVSIANLKSKIFYKLKRKKYHNIATLKALVKEKEAKHLALLKQLEKEYPTYYEMKYDYKVRTIAELQEGLQEDEVFLEYVATDSFVYVMAIGKNNIETAYTPVLGSLGSKIRRFKKAIKKHTPSIYLTLGTTLYQYVFNEKIQESIAGKRLIIAADAELSYIPFGVLPIENSNPNDVSNTYSNTSFLIEQYPISYSYSAQLYLLNLQLAKHEQRSKNIATWAPSFESVQPVLQTNEIADSLAELPDALKEAEDIAQLFGGNAWTGSQAKESLFKQQAPLYNVLHIVTHGILDDEDPLYSSLVLASDSLEDGLLHTYELFNMQLGADMAVLSACNSGMGELAHGEGVVSIARGFAYAGVPNIVMSTWPVSDATTKVLMSSFYDYLKQGLTKDVAMQKAKMDFLATHQENNTILAPFYWGGFLVVGNTTPVPSLIQSTAWRFWAFIGLLLLIGISVFYLRKKQAI